MKSWEITNENEKEKESYKLFLEFGNYGSHRLDLMVQETLTWLSCRQVAPTLEQNLILTKIYQAISNGQMTLCIQHMKLCFPFLFEDQLTHFNLAKQTFIESLRSGKMKREEALNLTKKLMLLPGASPIQFREKLISSVFISDRKVPDEQVMNLDCREMLILQVHLQICKYFNLKVPSFYLGILFCQSVALSAKHIENDTFDDSESEDYSEDYSEAEGEANESTEDEEHDATEKLSDQEKDVSLKEPLKTFQGTLPTRPSRIYDDEDDTCIGNLWEDESLEFISAILNEPKDESLKFSQDLLLTRYIPGLETLLKNYLVKRGIVLNQNEDIMATEEYETVLALRKAAFSISSLLDFFNSRNIPPCPEILCRLWEIEFYNQLESSSLKALTILRTEMIQYASPDHAIIKKCLDSLLFFDANLERKTEIKEYALNINKDIIVSDLVSYWLQASKSTAPEFVLYLNGIITESLDFCVDNWMSTKSLFEELKIFELFCTKQEAKEIVQSTAKNDTSTTSKPAIENQVHDDGSSQYSDTQDTSMEDRDNAVEVLMDMFVIDEEEAEDLLDAHHGILANVIAQYFPR